MTSPRPSYSTDTVKSMDSIVPWVSPVVRPRLRTAVPTVASAMPFTSPMSTIEQRVVRAETSATAASTPGPEVPVVPWIAVRCRVPTTFAGQLPPSGRAGWAWVSPTLQLGSTAITW
jgi:hypothetical protein